MSAGPSGARELIQSLRPALTDLGKPKLAHAHGRESFQLSFEFRVAVRPVVDTQAALMLLTEVAGGGAGCLAAPRLGSPQPAVSLDA